MPGSISAGAAAPDFFRGISQMKYLDHLEEWIITFLIGAATLIIFVAVMHRYAAGLPIPGVQDWLLQAQHVLGTGTVHLHVCLDGQVRRRLWRPHRHPRRRRCADQPLSGPMRAKFIVFGMLAGALFTGIIGTLGAHFVWDNGAHYAIFNALGIGAEDLYPGPTTPDLEWQTWIVYSAIPLGSSLMCFRFLQVTVSFIKTGELPSHDHGHVDGIEDGEIPIDSTPTRWTMNCTRTTSSTASGIPKRKSGLTIQRLATKELAK